MSQLKHTDSWKNHETRGGKGSGDWVVVGGVARSPTHPIPTPTHAQKLPCHQKGPSDDDCNGRFNSDHLEALHFGTNK